MLIAQRVSARVCVCACVYVYAREREVYDDAVATGPLCVSLTDHLSLLDSHAHYSRLIHDSHGLAVSWVALREQGGGSGVRICLSLVSS
jgi:hypothetical protein